MAQRDKDSSELVLAAEALETELGTLESLSSKVQTIRLDSEKNISKAAKELADLLELPERLATGLAALAAAMQRMQARQQAALEPLAARANDIRERKRRLDEHMQAFAALGEATGAATALLESAREHAHVVDDVKARLIEIADRARALFEAARSDEFPDVAREADALAKRVTAVRRRLEG
jgi:chromosome segregation ATPase